MIIRKTTVASVLFVLCLCAGQVLAGVKLASPFTDHMVLQRGMMVPVWGIADPGNVHPKNKQHVVDRLMRIALAKAYGRKVEYSGPMYDSMKVEGNALHIKFTHSTGLTAKGGDPKTFTIAGKDAKFVLALARIEKGAVVVSSPDVPESAAPFRTNTQ